MKKNLPHNSPSPTTSYLTQAQGLLGDIRERIKLSITENNISGVISIRMNLMNASILAVIVDDSGEILWKSASLAKHEILGKIGNFTGSPVAAQGVEKMSCWVGCEDVRGTTFFTSVMPILIPGEGQSAQSVGGWVQVFFDHNVCLDADFCPARRLVNEVPS